MENQVLKDDSVSEKLSNEQKIKYKLESSLTTLNTAGVRGEVLQNHFAKIFAKLCNKQGAEYNEFHIPSQGKHIQSIRK